MPFDQEGFVVASPRVEAPVTDDVLARLVRGRERLAGGWCQCALRRDKMVCARGAIAPDVARIWSLDADDVAKIADAVLARCLPADFHNDGMEWDSDVVAYNNASTTTHADILALFDRAIAARRSEIGGR